MSLLDDLKQQAGQQQKPVASGQTPASVVDKDFYREHVKARMLAAYEFLTALVNQLNEMKLDTRAEYPFKPEGKSVALMQQDYKAYNDHITEPRQITLSFKCALVNPTSFNVDGRAAVLAQGEILDRFRFKYEKIEQKDARQMVTAAQFKLVGPLVIKIMLQVDEQRQVIKLLIGNFAGPGVSQYHLKPEQLDEAFLDRLGKYILRQETTLFKEELSADMRAKLRQRLQQERQQREAELKEIEAARQAEEALRKQNSTTSQLKKAVSQTVTGNTEKLKKAMNGQLKRVMHTHVAKGKDSLKGIFNKLKKQTQAQPQTLPASSIPPTKPAQPRQQVAAQSVRSAQINIPAKVIPPRPVPAGVAASKSASPPSPAVVQTKQVKKTKPPKVYNAPPNNPFLKPEPPVSSTEQEAKIAAVQPKLEATPVPDITLPPEVAAKALEAERANLNNVASTNPFLKPESPVEPASPVDATERESKTVSAPQEPEATMVMDISSHPELMSETLEADRANLNNAASTNPFLKPESPVEPDSPVDAVERESKTVSAPQEPEATMVMDISSHPELMSETLNADRVKVNNALSTSPFLKPESPVEPASLVDATEQEVKTASAPLELEPIPEAEVAPSTNVTAESSVELPANVAEGDVKSESASLALELTPVADIASSLDVTPPEPLVESSIDAVDEREVKTAITHLELESTPASPVEPLVNVTDREVKTVTAPLELEATSVEENSSPTMTPESSVAPPADVVELEVRTTTAQPEVKTTPVEDISSRPAVTPESLEADLARIIEADKQNKLQQTGKSSKTTNPVLQTPPTKVSAQAATSPAAVDQPSIDQTESELNTGLSDVVPKTSQAVSAKATTVTESKKSAQNPFLQPEELDLDLSSDVVTPENNDSKENS